MPRTSSRRRSSGPSAGSPASTPTGRSAPGSWGSPRTAAGPPSAAEARRPILAESAEESVDHRPGLADPDDLAGELERALGRLRRGVSHGLRPLPRARAALRGDRPGDRPAGRHRQDLAPSGQGRARRGPEPPRGPLLTAGRFDCPPRSATIGGTRFGSGHELSRIRRTLGRPARRPRRGPRPPRARPGSPRLGLLPVPGRLGSQPDAPTGDLGPHGRRPLRPTRSSGSTP